MGERIDHAASNRSLEDMSDHSKQKWLFKYLHAAKENSKTQTHLSLTLDIGSVSRKPFLVGYFATEDGVVVAPPPQACFSRCFPLPSGAFPGADLGHQSEGLGSNLGPGRNQSGA